jgi:hypothetical protein
VPKRSFEARWTQATMRPIGRPCRSSEKYVSSSGDRNVGCRRVSVKRARSDRSGERIEVTLAKLVDLSFGHGTLPPSAKLRSRSGGVHCGRFHGLSRAINGRS